MPTNQEGEATFTARLRPRPYMDIYYKMPEAEERFMLDSYHSAFTSGILKGKKSLLDIGSGPCPNNVVSASKDIKDITMSDYLEENCGLLRKWVNREEDAHDFGNVFQYVANLEECSNHKILEARVRHAIQEVIHIDVLKSNPIAPLEATFDVLTCGLTMGYASAAMRSYRRSFRNIANLLNPGGFLLMASSLGHASPDPSHALPDTWNKMESALHAAGLEAILFSVLPRGGDDAKIADCFFAVAHKMTGLCPFRPMVQCAFPRMNVAPWHGGPEAASTSSLGPIRGGRKSKRPTQPYPKMSRDTVESNGSNGSVARNGGSSIQSLTNWTLPSSLVEAVAVDEEVAE